MKEVIIIILSFAMCSWCVWKWIDYLAYINETHPFGAVMTHTEWKILKRIRGRKIKREKHKEKTHEEEQSERESNHRFKRQANSNEYS